MFKKLWALPTLLLASAIFLTACSSDHDSSPAQDTIVTKTVNGAKVATTTLPNGIKVLMVSSPDATAASLTVSVGAGTNHEPAQLAGLAHFLEHVLFLGNAENPVAGEYFEFMREKGANFNATTQAELTNYYFNIDLKNYEEGVRRLSRFFVSPLFEKSLVASEKAVIHNEYALRMKQFQPFRARGAYYEKGSFSRRFNIGNNESLKDVTVEDAKNFFETNYAPQNMTVVVNGPQPIAKLQDIATKAFSDVPARPGAKPLKQDKLDESTLGRLMKVENDQLENRLSLTFNTSVKEISRGTQQILGTILGDEGPGSLLSVLQARGLAARTKGAITGGTQGTRLYFSIQLTPDGVERYKEVIAIAKGYVEFMKTSPLPSHLVNKSQGLFKASKFEIDYSKGDFETMISWGATLLSGVTLEELTGVPDLNLATEKEYKDVLAAVEYDKFFGVLTANSKNVTVSNLGLDKHVYSNSDRLDEVTVSGKKYLIDGWYGGAYEVLQPQTAELAPQSDSGFRLPPENPYVPMQFAMYEADFSVEALSGKNADIRLNPGAGQVLPKSSFTAFLTPMGLDKSDKKQMSQFILMMSWITASLNQDGYQFEEVGYTTNISTRVSEGSLMLQFSGWSDRFEKAVGDYIKAIRFSEDEVAFQKFKQVQIISLNQASQSPEVAVSETFNKYYYPNFPTRLERVAAIENMTLAELKKIYEMTFKEFYFQGVLSGNIQSSQGQAILDALAQKWPQETVIPVEKAEQLQEVLKVGLVQPVTVDINLGAITNSSVANFYEFGAGSQREENMARILSSWIEQPFFNEIRTMQQLSYGPYAMFQELSNQYGIYFSVDSGTHSAAYVAERVNAFIIQWVTDDLPKKTQADVDSKIAEFKSNEVGKTLSHQQAVFDYLFEADEKLSDDEQKYDIKVEDVIEFARKKLIQSPEGVFVRVKSTLDFKETQQPLNMGAK